HRADGDVPGLYAVRGEHLPEGLTAGHFALKFALLADVQRGNARSSHVLPGVTSPHYRAIDSLVAPVLPLLALAPVRRPAHVSGNKVLVARTARRVAAGIGRLDRSRAPEAGAPAQSCAAGRNHLAAVSDVGGHPPVI